MLCVLFIITAVILTASFHVTQQEEGIKGFQAEQD